MQNKNTTQDFLNSKWKTTFIVSLAESKILYEKHTNELIFYLEQTLLIKT